MIIISDKKLVFLTGGTGNMGSHTVKEFLKRTDRFRIRLLALDNKSERRKLLKYRFNRNVEIVYGDMRDKGVIEKCVDGADFVLHIGALVSPMADDDPKLCMEINYGSTINIIEAIKRQDKEIGFVFIGTVGETGDRPSPIHWGRVGDPIKPSMFDYYSVSKVAAERAVIESGLNKWVVLRQTGMLPVNRKAQNDPIIFHQNLGNVIEWITAEESARLMGNVCEDWIPKSFWKRVYNIGGGEKWRFTFYELLQKMLREMDVDIKAVYDPRDLTLYNFHGQWYTDSDELNDIADYRFVDPKEYFNNFNRKIKLVKAIPILNRLLPTTQSLKKQMDIISKKARGPKWMIDNNSSDWIKAFYGSIDKKENIKSWQDGYSVIEPCKDKTYLNHGYDETKEPGELCLDDMIQAAKYRGGECFSTDMKMGVLYSKLNWRCHKGHEFNATPYLIIKAGHWCPICEKEAWDFANMARRNEFFKQVWWSVHGDNDGVYIEKVLSEDDVKN